MHKLFLLLILFFLDYLRSNAQSLEKQVVAQYLAAIGGQEKLASIRTSYGYYYDTMQNCATQAWHFKHPNLFLVSFSEHCSKTDTIFSIQAYDGQHFWRKGLSGEIDILPQADAKYFASSIRAVEGSFFLLPDSILSVRYHGSMTLKEKKYQILRVRHQDWPIANFYYFDDVTKLLAFTTPEEQYSPQIKQCTTYKDYRNVQGLLLPYLQEDYRYGKLKACYKTIAFAIDIEIDDLIFKGTLPKDR